MEYVPRIGVSRRSEESAICSGYWTKITLSSVADAARMAWSFQA